MTARRIGVGFVVAAMLVVGQSAPALATNGNKYPKLGYCAPGSCAEDGSTRACNTRHCSPHNCR